MEQINLLGQARQQTGKCPAGRLRRGGMVPAVLYGAGVKGAVSLALNTKELEKVLHTAAGGNVLINLSIEGDKATTVMFKDIYRHPLNASIQHVDLFAIQMDHRITVEIPVHIVGKAAGLAFGGIVQQETRKIRIECLPADIPDSLDLDVTPLAIGQSLHVRDVALKDGLRAVDEPEMTIVSVVAPTAEVAPKTAEEVQAELAKSFEEKEEEKKEE